MTSTDDPEPPPDSARGEIVVREPPDRGPFGRDGARGPSGPGWIPWVALAVGLGLSVLLTRHGAFFFFLPIILPFGLGGGSWLRRTIFRNRR